MFDFVESNKKIVQIILGLVILTFMFWGIQSYRSGGASKVASVNGKRIGVEAFDAALKQQQERLRDMLGKNADQAMFDSPGFKAAVLERLIQQNLILDEAEKVGIAVTNAQLIAAIQAIPAFQKDGAFSDERYKSLLRSQGLTPVRFESEVREDLERQQLLGVVAQNGFVSHASAVQFAKILDQKRMVSEASFSPAQYLAAQQVGQDEIAKYYKDNLEEFKVPQQVKVQYLVFSPETLQSQVQVSDAEAKQYFESHAAEFAVPEERDASHILIAVPKDAPQDKVAAAKAKAEKIMAQLKLQPSKFAEMAKQYSQDPGSAENGGDLGFFKRGMMVKSFDAAVFSMKPGEIAGPIRSEFGFHIIKLNAVKPGKSKDFAEVKDEIVSDIRQQEAGRKFSENAEKFSDMVYEQSGTLKDAADAFKLPIQTSGWLDESGSNTAFPSNAKLLKSIFSDDAMKKKRNTEAIEVSPNVLVSARVVDEKPAFTKPLADVSGEIRSKLLQRKAMDAALKDGKNKLDALQAGKDAGISWKAEVSVSRRDPGELTQDVMAVVFKADVSKLPVYVGVPGNGGYTVVKISKVVEATDPSPAELAGMTGQLQQAVSGEALSEYFNALKSRAKITVNSSLLTAKPAD
jgi:peptidyl-prolyl cis-trans isomerase D